MAAQLSTKLTLDGSQHNNALRDATKEVSKYKREITSANGSLDQIRKRFETITNSTQPVRRQLRELQMLMTNMNLNGLANTDVFTEIAQRAGELRDAMADSQQAVNAYANDTFKLQAATQMFQGIAGAISIGTSAMGLFGVENEKVNKTLLKVQSAMALVNGLQQIANILNKDSALMLRIKQIRLAANAATTGELAVATTGATAATTANTVATKVNTAAQRAWNTTKAVGKALFGDFTGLLILGATALTVYAAATNDSTEELEEQQKATKEAANTTKDYTSILADSYANLMTSYSKLKSSYNALRTEHEKKKWIKDNATELDNLNLSITNVESAEKAFNGNTDAVIQSFMKRAKAAALLAELTDEYRKQMQLMDKKESLTASIQKDAVANGRSAKAGDLITDESYRSSRYGSVGRDGKWRFSESGASLYSGTNVSGNKQIQDLNRQIEESNKHTNKLAAEISKLETTTSRTSYNRPTSSSRSGSNKSSSSSKNYESGSIADLQNEIDKLKSKLENTNITQEEAKNVSATIKQLEKQLEDKKIAFGLKEPPESDIEKAAKKTQEQLKKLSEKYSSISFSPKKSSFESITNTDNKKNLSAIKEQMDFNDDLIEKLKELQAEYAKLGDAGKEAYDKLNEKIKEVTNNQESLGEEAKNAINNIKENDEAQKKFEDISDVADSTGKAFSALGNVFSATGDESTAAIMNVVGTTASAVAEIIPQVMKLIGVKQAEALASGTAASAGVPFPGNIAAIAAIIATITSVFASIASLGSFADGGIIQGRSTIGDYNLARVNGGEMILNTRQQNNLFRAINDNRLGYNSSVVGGTIKIKGSDLYVALKNYGSTKSKVGKNIGIR